MRGESCRKDMTVFRSDNCCSPCFIISRERGHYQRSLAKEAFESHAGVSRKLDRDIATCLTHNRR